MQDDLVDDYELKILIKQFLDKHPLSSLNFLIDSIPDLNYSKLEILKKEYANYEEERKKKKISFEIEEDSNKGKNLLKYFVKIVFFLSSTIIGLVISNYNALSLSAIGLFIIGITGILNNTVVRYIKNRNEDVQDDLDSIPLGKLKATVETPSDPEDGNAAARIINPQAYNSPNVRTLFHFVSPIPWPNGVVFLYLIGVFFIIFDIFFQIFRPGIIFT